MAKGIQNMSVEDIKTRKGEESSEPVIKRTKGPKKAKLHNRVGYGSFKTTIVMKDASGKLVRVNREQALARIEQGFVPMSKTKYREALAAGAADIVAVEIVKSKKKK